MFQISDDLARALRDELIRAYPLEDDEPLDYSCSGTVTQDPEDFAEQFEDAFREAIGDENIGTWEEHRGAKWQEVTVDLKGAGHTYRLAVPGGWLYRTVTYRFPELHALLENATEEDAEWELKNRDHRLIKPCMEILTQTCVFVPDA